MSKTIAELQEIIKTKGAGELTPTELAAVKKLQADNAAAAGDTRQLIFSHAAAGKKAREIGQLIGKSVQYVSKILGERKDWAPEPPLTPLKLPAFNPKKPASPQCEAIGLALLVDSAKNGTRAQKINTARELMRISQRDKVPPPANRRMKFVIEIIDVLEDDKIHVVAKNSYEVRP